MTDRLHALHASGQAVWLDYIDRGLVSSGELARRIADDSLTGMTSNPAIFEKALAQGTLYDAQVARATVRTPWELFEEIETDDVRAACDVFRSVYDATHGADGFVSIEVSPAVAHDTAATVAEARRIWSRVERPNVMVKVPGTAAGVPAVRELTASGVNVNITLLFAVEAHRRVIGAYLEGLELRADAGEDISSVASVASFFVSRVDSMVDARVDALVKGGTIDAARAAALKGKAAIANAKLAYALAREQVLGSAVGQAHGDGRAHAAPALGEYEHQEPRVPRRDVRGATDRPRHREHASAGDARCIPRPR